MCPAKERRRYDANMNKMLLIWQLLRELLRPKSLLFRLTTVHRQTHFPSTDLHETHPTGYM